MPPQNLFQPPGPRATDTELLDTILSAAPKSHLRIERIESPPGHASVPDFWYDQSTTEWVLLLKGRATLSFRDPDETLDLQPGDHLTIPPHRRHRIDSTHPQEPTLWLTIHWH